MRRSAIPRRGIFGLVFLFIIQGPAALPAGAQKAPSAKDLVRQAETDRQNNRWPEAREKLKQAQAQKPKDKQIAETLRTVENYLADQGAAKASTLCDQLEINSCERELGAAASIAVTPRVQEAQAKLAARKRDVLDRWNGAQKMILDARLEEANAELQSLTRFSYLLPSLAQEKERVRVLRVEAALAQGSKELSAQNWDAAQEFFQTALRLDSGNSAATRGAASVKQEKEAVDLFQQAQSAFQAKAFQAAFEANQKALRLFPSRPPYRELATQIAAEWSKILLEESRKFSANPDSLKDNQRALEVLEMVRRLDSQTPGLGDELKTIRLTLQSIYLQKAGELEAIADNSRIATAYAYYISAQQTNPGGEFAFAAKVREAGGIFARKRSVQLMVGVDNLAPAPPAFAEVVSRRVRSVIEKLGLPDLKLRALDEYEKNPGEDPQFVENRPDGKSPTARFTVEVNKHESETAGGDKPLEKPSKFISGQEMVRNPEYDKLQAEFRNVSESLGATKPGKRNKDGYTSQGLTMLQQQLASTPREIARDKVSDYSYQELQLSVSALVKLNLEMRDMLEKQLLGSEAVEKADKKSTVEIAGVRDKDVNHLFNKPARLPAAEQILRECERSALEQMDAKVQRLVTQYLQRFHAEAEKALREGRAEDALENFLCHWYFFRGRLEEKQSRQILDLVKSQLGIDLNAAAAAPGGF